MGRVNTLVIIHGRGPDTRVCIVHPLRVRVQSLFTYGQRLIQPYLYQGLYCRYPTYAPSLAVEVGTRYPTLPTRL